MDVLSTTALQSHQFVRSASVVFSSEEGSQPPHKTARTPLINSLGTGLPIKSVVDVDIEVLVVLHHVKVLSQNAQGL